MANNAAQLAQIIKKLLEKTGSGQQRWAQSLRPNRYQARFGDYSVEISGTPGQSPFKADAAIKVTKLDGTNVAEAGGATTSAVASVLRAGSGAQLDYTAQNDLNRLFELVSDRSSDLDELLDLI